jgi:hypothetical protein
MSTVPISEPIPDNGHDSASQAAKAAEAKRTRQPVYNVFEYAEAFSPQDLHRCLSDLAARAGLEDGSRLVQEIYEEAMRVVCGGWFVLVSDVNGATDRKAIEAVIGTQEDPVEGFDAVRRLGVFCAVLTRHWEPRQRTRTVTEGWA